MKFNGDILKLAPKEYARSVIFSNNKMTAKIKDKTGLIYTFELIDGKWTIVLLKRVDNRKRRLKDGRKNKRN